MRQALGNHWDLIAASVLTVASGACLLLVDSSAVRVIVALVFAFFLPGYLFLAALEGGSPCWGRGQMALAAPGLSIAIVGILAIGLAMHSWLTSSNAGLLLLGWNLSSLLVAVGRRRRNAVPSAARETSRGASLVGTVIRPKWRGLGLGVCASILFLTFAGLRLAARAGESHPAYTELFLLDPNGGIGAHHSDVSPGEVVSFGVGIANHEGETSRYRLDICSGYAQCEPSRGIVLDDGAQTLVWVSVRAPDAMGPTKILFRLLRDNQDTPYREVHAWIDVTGNPQ